MSRPSNSPAQERPKRTPIGRGNRLKVEKKEDGYTYRYVNTNLEKDPDRVARFMEAGYEIVPKASSGSLGDKRVDNPSPLGSSATLSVGQGTQAVLMRIRKDWYEEDQRAKQADIDAIEQTMSKDAKSDYGTITRESKNHG
jgi:hypothetical protein